MNHIQSASDGKQPQLAKAVMQMALEVISSERGSRMGSSQSQVTPGHLAH